MRHQCLVKKYNKLSVLTQTPNMTASSVNGYTASSLISLWNLNATSQYCSAASTLTFPSKMRVTKILFGSTFTSDWYMPHDCTLYLYLNGNIVYTLNYDSRSYKGATVDLGNGIMADSAWRNVGYNSDWQWNDGEGRPERDYNNGCALQGYLY